MNEWTVVTVIVTLVGLGAAVIRPLISLNTSITRLASIVNELEKSVSGLTVKNSDAHGRIWNKLGEHEDALFSHETRLLFIEKGSGK
jgi:hypothetical protein